MVILVRCDTLVFTVNGKWIGIAPAYDWWTVYDSMNRETISHA